MLISLSVLLLFFIFFSFFWRWYSSRRAFISLHTQGSLALETGGERWVGAWMGGWVS